MRRAFFALYDRFVPSALYERLHFVLFSQV
jgi:hypothetical protein